VNWVPLPGQLRIEAPPAARAQLDVSAPRFGGCSANDGRDDTDCIVAALRAAQDAGGAALIFPPGEWLLDDVDSPGVDRTLGIVVPEHVDLLGNAAQPAQLTRGPRWQARKDAPLFTLSGHNEILGLNFRQAARPRDVAAEGAFLQIGPQWQLATAAAQIHPVLRITIAHNSFAGAALAVRSGGLPIRDLVVTHNRFAAHRLALSLGGDSRNTRTTFRIEDAIVSGNRFEPGSYLDAAIAQGARAAEFGAGERMDFSGNIADGAALTGLDSPADPRGWRAAFFWHLLGPSGQLLIADNDITCSGDKAGDGEAIALDSNHNTLAFDDAPAIVAADTVHVVVKAALNTRVSGDDIDPRNFYRGHWVQIVAGTGVGQSRRISRIDLDSATGLTTFSVQPAFDVVPAAGDSRISVGRTFWQALIVGNRIDHRQPLCAKSNRTAARGGAISIWAPTTDSVVALNRQFDTNGIAFQQLAKPGGLVAQYFLEIRGNEIDGDYDPRRGEGQAAIRASHGAAEIGIPPVANFGTVIAGNVIRRTEAATGAALRIAPTWFRGPAPHRWPLIDRLLVYGNGFAGSPGGFDIAADSLLRNAVFLDNTCRKDDRGAPPARGRSLMLCPTPGPYCECAARE
jgi:hypothetical protein